MTPPRLTAREQDILRAYARHGVHKLIAHELGISEQTVKNHTTRILTTYGVASLGQAAVLFDRAHRDKWPAVERRVGERRARSAHGAE